VYNKPPASGLFVPVIKKRALTFGDSEYDII
jgi:hypothetical protein